MSDDLVKQSIEELRELVRCRCHPAYTDRGLHNSDCMYYMDASVKIVADRIEDFERMLVNSIEAGVIALDPDAGEIDRWFAMQDLLTTLAKLKGGTDDRHHTRSA